MITTLAAILREPRKAPLPRLLLPAMLLPAACSVVPDRDYPGHRDGRYVVEYDVPPGTRPLRLRIPASSPDLTVYELHSEPPLEEAFRAGHRYLLVPDGPARVEVRARLRDFGIPGDEGLRFRAPEELFPDAAHIRATYPDGSDA